MCVACYRYRCVRGLCPFSYVLLLFGSTLCVAFCRCRRYSKHFVSVLHLCALPVLGSALILSSSSVSFTSVRCLLFGTNLFGSVLLHVVRGLLSVPVGMLGCLREFSSGGILKLYWGAGGGGATSLIFQDLSLW